MTAETPSSSRLTGRQKGILAVLAIVVLVTIFFWRFVFLGEIPLNGDWLVRNFEPWRAFFGSVKVQNAELDDPIILHYPLWSLGREMMRAGTPPIWNPYIFCGAPLLADSMSHPFDVLNVATLALPDMIAWGYVLFLSFVIAGITFWFYLREIGLGRLAALGGAVCYVLNGFFVVWAEYRFMVGAFCWLPLTLIALERIIKGRTMAFALMGGVALGFQVLAGNLHFLLVSGILLGAYAVWRIRNAACTWGAPTALRALKGVAIMVVVGAGLSAIQWLPTVDFIPYTQRSRDKYTTCNFLHPLELISLVAPKFFGHPGDGNYVGNYLFPRSYVTMNTPYVGALGLMLAFVGLMSWRRRMWVRFYGAVALGVVAFLLLLKVQRAHFVMWLLVPIDTLDHHRLLVLTAMGLAVLAGCGMDELQEAAGRWWAGQRDRGVRSSFVHLRVAAAGGLVLVGLLLLSGVAIKASGAKPAAELVNPSILDYLVALCARFGTPLAAPQIMVSVIAVCLSAALAVVWSQTAGVRWIGQVAPMVCVIVLAADLLYFGMQYNPFVSRKLIYPKLGVTEFLKPRLGLSRISGVDTPESNPWKGDCFPPSSAIPYGLTDVRGKDGFYPDRTRRFMVTIRRKLNVQFEASVHFDHVRSKLFSLMGMRYVLSRDEINEPGLKCVLRDGVRVYENPAAYPRAFIVHQARLINQEWVTQWILYHGRFEPDKQVILEEEPYGFPLETAAKPGSTARVAEYTPTKVVVDAEMKSPGFLILTDAYAPGWEVTVDGVPSRLLAGDLLFRCVPLRHGPHRVEFRYRPMSFMVGAFLTVLTLLGVPGVLLGFRWR